jgi:hypothetical protein
MAYETEAEREARQKAERAAETAAHKQHLETPSLVKSKNYWDLLPVTSFSPPEIPATPDAQDIADVLVTMGFATQAEA